MDMLRWVVWGVPVVMWWLATTGDMTSDMTWVLGVGVLAYLAYVVAIMVRRGRTLWLETAACGLTLMLVDLFRYPVVWSIGFWLVAVSLVWGGIRGLRHLYRRNRGVHVVTS